MGGLSMNFREGMRRGILGGVAAGFYSYLIAVEVRNSYVGGTLKESLWIDCAALLALPVFGFLIPWGAIRTLVWIQAGFSK
jgi:hypothetical protein